jgi:hypothetical protein
VVAVALLASVLFLPFLALLLWVGVMSLALLQRNGVNLPGGNLLTGGRRPVVGPGATPGAP